MQKITVIWKENGVEKSRVFNQPYKTACGETNFSVMVMSFMHQLSVKSGVTDIDTKMELI